jgi:hypothetical protein
MCDAGPQGRCQSAELRRIPGGIAEKSQPSTTANDVLGASGAQYFFRPNRFRATSTQRSTRIVDKEYAVIGLVRVRRDGPIRSPGTPRSSARCRRRSKRRAAASSLVRGGAERLEHADGASRWRHHAHRGTRSRSSSRSPRRRRRHHATSISGFTSREGVRHRDGREVMQARTSGTSGGWKGDSPLPQPRPTWSRRRPAERLAADLRADTTIMPDATASTRSRCRTPITTTRSRSRRTVYSETHVRGKNLTL